MRRIKMCFAAVLLFVLVAANLSVVPSAMSALGHRLFFDVRLSANGTKSCATCHAPELAFTDGYRQSLGIFADITAHNASSLLNLDSYASLNWACPKLTSAVEQMKIPLFGTHPIELGLSASDTAVLSFVLKDSIYAPLWRAAFPQKNTANFDDIIAAIAAYTVGLVSRNTPFDKNTLSEEAKNGFQVFESARVGCRKCHSGRDFNQAEKQVGENFQDIGFGKVRTPSLRNVAITGPYFHDGSEANLSACVKHFTAHAKLTDQEHHALLSFLYSLTDTSYLAEPYFRNPF